MTLLGAQAQTTQPLVRWDWVWDHLDDIWAQTVEHLVLTAYALGVGIVLSAALAFVALRWRWTFHPISWMTGVLYTIPSLALFVILIPITGLSKTTALIGLVSYTLLILVRNIVAGIDGVPGEVREAAAGMGYNRRSLLWRVEVPLALPVIVAGIRVAAVTTVGLVTVTALIGEGGLGQLILTGLNRFFTTPLIVGAVLSVALALLIDLALVSTQRALTPWARRRA
ncbi:MAG: ABC transporter permease [Acidimicrobiia bacterium]